MSISRLDFDAVSAFAVFADCMNFSAAAQHLHISQPALHKKIRKLGEQLDRLLYRRVGRALELTPHGETLARYGRQLRTGAETLSQELAGKGEYAVTLAAGEGAYLYLLGEGIRRYRRESAGALRLFNLDRDQTLAAVLGGKAQLGVAPLESVPEGIQAFSLTSVGQVVAMPTTHRLAGRSRLKLKDLAGEHIVVPPADRPHRQMLAAMLQSENVDWKVAMEASGWELILSFVALGVGIAVVNACCRLPKGIVSVALPELPSLRYHCFHLRGMDKAEAIVRLRTHLLAHGNDWRSRA